MSTMTQPGRIANKMKAWLILYRYFKAGIAENLWDILQIKESSIESSKSPDILDKFAVGLNVFLKGKPPPPKSMTTPP